MNSRENVSNTFIALLNGMKKHSWTFPMWKFRLDVSRLVHYELSSLDSSVKTECWFTWHLFAWHVTRLQALAQQCTKRTIFSSQNSLQIKSWPIAFTETQSPKNIYPGYKNPVIFRSIETGPLNRIISPQFLSKAGLTEQNILPADYRFAHNNLAFLPEM